MIVYVCVYKMLSFETSTDKECGDQSLNYRAEIPNSVS